MLIDKVARFPTGRSIGSLKKGAPLGIVTDGLPSNDTLRSEPGCIAPFESASATRAAPITSGFVPYSLVKRILRRRPPLLTRTSWRMVTFSNDGVAGNGPIAGVGGSGAAPQVCTHSAAPAMEHSPSTTRIPLAN